MIGLGSRSSATELRLQILAGVTGIEPVYPGFRDLCLTAWLHPNRSGGICVGTHHADRDSCCPASAASRKLFVTTSFLIDFGEVALSDPPTEVSGLSQLLAIRCQFVGEFHPIWVTNFRLSYIEVVND